MRLSSIFLAIGALGAAAATGSCTEPVHDQQVRALGAEVDGVPTGEYHRAGQPCLTCHGSLGPANSRFSIAGTVFWGPTKPVGQEDVEILMIDAAGTQPPQVKTNCVGNFFLRPDQWDPQYPVLVRVARGQQSQAMVSHISRDGSCASCHRLGAPDFDTPGHVFLANKADENVNPIPQAKNCPVNPSLAKGGGQ